MEKENTTSPELGDAVASDSVDGQKAKKPKKPINKKKAGIIAAIVAVVIVVGGVGFWNFHNTPEFCDFLCHNPQDPYNPTYYAQTGEAAVDKWGNDVADASGMLAAVHREQADANCLSCHEPTFKEQVTEGIEWASGNFYNPLSERSLDNLVRWHDGMDGTEFCLNESCHNLTKTDLTAETDYMARNVHSWHHSEYTCSDCHKSHRASVLICTQCHTDCEVPEGWISAEEEQQLPARYLAYDLEEVAYEK